MELWPSLSHSPHQSDLPALGSVKWDGLYTGKSCMLSDDPSSVADCIAFVVSFVPDGAKFEDTVDKDINRSNFMGGAKF